MTDSATYPVNEIFYSLQGEGFHTGTPAIFIRLSGCNLRCQFCDTDFSSFRTLSVSEIIAEAESFPAPTVIITGGEPSLFNLEPLISALHASGKRVHIETNGTNPIKGTPDWITLSPKEGSEIRLPHWDELKIVYTGTSPLTLWPDLIAATPAGRLFLQPCSGLNIPQTIEFILTNPNFRLSLQTHKLLDIR